MLYRGEEAANQENEERWGDCIFGGILIGALITAIGSGIWFHTTATAHNLSYSELANVIFSAVAH